MSQFFINSSSGGGSGTVTDLQGDAGGPVPPTDGVIHISGASTTYTNGNAGASLLDIEVVSSQFTFLQGTGPTTPSTPTGPLNDGQLIIGATGARAIPANLNAGSGISIVNGPNSITISASGAAISVNRQVFTTSGTYTPTSNMIYCIVEAVGGGGGGGGADAFVNPLFVVSGSGGGSGGYANGLFSAATIGASQSVTIGSGGSGAAGSGNGSSGTATSFGSLITCNPGTFGSTNSPDYVGGTEVGGGGGTATGGDYQVPGQMGSGGTAYSITTPAPVGTPTGTLLTGISGQGGSTPLGNGAPLVGVTNPGITASQGFNGSGYGSGGSSAVSVDNSILSPLPGGNGSPGIVIVTEYIVSSGGSSSFTWNVITMNTTLVADNGYIVQGGTLILTMPVSASVGQIIEIAGMTGSWTLNLNGGQSIVFNSNTATTSVTSTLPTDCIRFVCTNANTVFEVLSSEGNPTVL